MNGTIVEKKIIPQWGWVVLTAVIFTLGARCRWV